MAYDCRVYRVLIASPSDVEAEREIAARVIQEWNDLYSYSRKVALLPLRWETHTAPEYGTRPQEVINRAIVDECDLLVGIFWTRIGSPTGAADSGTLEEIERMGKAGKPIMLYFSRVEIDPDKIDSDQFEKLKQFKQNTYPKGLTESYKKPFEFRDKFARQLELKIRDLQLSEASKPIPLLLGFLSMEKAELAGSSIRHSFKHLNVRELDSVPEEKREEVEGLVARAVRERSYLPVALAIENSSPSGVRNVYVELDFSATSEKVELTQSPLGVSLFEYRNVLFGDSYRSEVWESTQRTVAKFEEGNLQRTNVGWRLSFEWEALQPQRIRLIKPVLYLYSPESAKLSITAKVFADSFPEPFLLGANVSIEAKQSFITLTDLLPDWEKILSTAKQHVFLSTAS
jgi:hypothetical protein